MNQSPSFEQVIESQSNSILLEYQHWVKYEVFSFQFWLLVAMLIIPWIVWYRLVDKKRILEIIIHGLFVVTIATFLDEIGCQLNLWEYKIDIEPYFPRLIPMNFSILPVIYMCIYQYFPGWKSFIKASIIGAGIYTFLGEPILVALKIYILINWKHIFSFPFYIIISISLKALTQMLININQRTQ